jgi:hypothetical protein
MKAKRIKILPSRIFMINAINKKKITITIEMRVILYG